MGVTEGVSWGEFAAEPASFALPEFSGMAMKEAFASTGPLVTSTFASACRHTVPKLSNASATVFSSAACHQARLNMGYTSQEASIGRAKVTPILSQK